MDRPDAIHRATPEELVERNAAERRGVAFLIYRDGSGAQRILDLGAAPQRLTIGRSSASGLALEWDAEVSRVHASLECVDGEWTLVEDGSSRNGAFVDGERLHGRRRLRDRDTIRLGRSVIVFRGPQGRESLRTMTSQEQLAPAVTDAQLRVLTALCRPYAGAPFAVPASNREIADELIIGVETVKTHMRALFAAFAIGDLPQHQKRAALAQRALATRLVVLSELA